MKTYMQPWLRNTIIQKFSFTAVFLYPIRLGKRCEIIGYIYTKIHNDLLTTKTLPTKVSEEVEAHVCLGTFPSSYFGLACEQALVHPPVQLVKFTRVKSGNRSERTKLFLLDPSHTSCIARELETRELRCLCHSTTESLIVC